MDAFVRRAYLARIRDFTQDAHWPANKQAIIADAAAHNTPSDIMSDLMRLPARQFATIEDLVNEIDALKFGVRSGG